ncbi:ABC transporter permease [Agromyces atrinae]|uniref:ABC transporter permease n=1 Tax=Agromyces atrinae TaxID=592376 RepID=A0A4Q2M8H4_9MICO|nr:iron chelate uptake ABC transporter family permease subunit [Agromyces atrinae]RXZ88389.1 ABC transporter permease [Agromyces atrinae]
MSTVATRSARRHSRWALPCAFVLVAGLVVASLFVGVYDLGRDEFGGEIFWISRVPRTIALVLAGCAMSVSGLIMQLLVQNRFVEPSTTGTAEWAALGLLLTVILAPNVGLTGKMIVASIFAFLGTLVFLGVLRRVALRSSLIVPLIGIMLGAVVSAFTTYLAVSTNLLQMLGTWFMGSFTSVVRGRYEVLWVVGVIVVIAYIVADRFTVAGLGKDVATSVGVHYDRVILVGTSLVAVATGVTTVVVGFLPFLGLVVPNLVSMIRGDNLRSNIPWVCLGGVAIIIVCDIIGRVIRAPFEIPVSMILGIVGSAVFITLLLRQRSRG